MGLLRLLREHAGAVEADLQRFYGIDIRDRWRFEHGRRVLPLRRIYVLVTHLPGESSVAAVMRDNRPHWSLTDHLLDDLRMAMTQTKKRPAKPHPMRPKPKPKRLDLKRLARARARRAERQRRIDAGEIT